MYADEAVNSYMTLHMKSSMQPTVKCIIGLAQVAGGLLDKQMCDAKRKFRHNLPHVVNALADFWTQSSPFP